MTVIFQSHHQFEFCDRILQSWSEDDGESPFVFTSSPEASLASLKLLQLFSPLARETIASIRSLLMGKKLHKFELAALANLCPETPEEAKSLIPSLEGRFADEELASLLEDIQTKRSFQY